MWIVIPAAGESKRFRAEGWLVRKPLIVLKSPEGEEDFMVNFVKRSIPPTLQHSLVIAHKENYFPLGPYDYQLHIYKTTGQADTILQVLRELPRDEEVVILDCDTVLEPADVKIIADFLQVYDVTIAVAETFDPNASRVDSVPFPTRFVEKEPISQWGIIGARGFKNIGLLIEALEKTVAECAAAGIESYLSMAINHYPGRSFAHVITKYVDLGTPERIKEAGWEIL